MNIKPRLISFKLCPFVQKTVILLRHKQIDHDIDYIDLANPPEWFLKISPFGKVPVLVMGDDVIFESSVMSSTVEDFPLRYHQAGWKRQGYLSSFLNADLFEPIGEKAIY